jgi:hypothetical protein
MTALEPVAEPPLLIDSDAPGISAIADQFF